MISQAMHFLVAQISASKALFKMDDGADGADGADGVDGAEEVKLPRVCSVEAPELGRDVIV